MKYVYSTVLIHTMQIHKVQICTMQFRKYPKIHLKSWFTYFFHSSHLRKRTQINFSHQTFRVGNSYFITMAKLLNRGRSFKKMGNKNCRLLGLLLSNISSGMYEFADENKVSSLQSKKQALFVYTFDCLILWLAEIIIMLIR